MIAVADTSPINYLLLIKEIDILPKMYGTVVILRPVAPEIVRAWIGGAPAWLEIRSPIDAPDSSLANLDPGERDAIMLATELRADQLIVDDREGRKRAEERRIPVIGTLGVLKEAATLQSRSAAIRFAMSGKLNGAIAVDATGRDMSIGGWHN
jgi:predicted nucleic acid-binding protein